MRQHTSIVVPEGEATPRTAFLCEELRRLGVDIESIMMVAPTESDLDKLRMAIIRILRSSSEK